MAPMPAFARLSPADQARLKRKSIALKLTRSGKLPQPCQALCGPKCTLYASRPDYCRRFECLLLKKCNTGQVSPELALKVIRTARRRLAKAEKLFQALGDHDRVVAISVRFRRLACSIESSPRDARASARMPSTQPQPVKFGHE